MCWEGGNERKKDFFKEKYFQGNLIESNISVNNTFTEFKEQKEHKEKKGNYQYIVKKVKKVNQPILSEKRQFIKNKYGTI